MTSFNSGFVSWEDLATLGLDPVHPAINFPRATYAAPLTFTAPSSGFLTVVMDNALATPSEDKFRIFVFGAGATPYLIGATTAYSSVGVTPGVTVAISAAGVVTITRANAAETSIAYHFDARP